MAIMKLDTVLILRKLEQKLARQQAAVAETLQHMEAMKKIAELEAVQPQLNIPKDKK